MRLVEKWRESELYNKRPVKINKYLDSKWGDFEEAVIQSYVLLSFNFLYSRKITTRWGRAQWKECSYNEASFGSYHSVGCTVVTYGHWSHTQPHRLLLMIDYWLNMLIQTRKSGPTFSPHIHSTFTPITHTHTQRHCTLNTYTAKGMQQAKIVETI
jgi:hypothetical protein